MSYHLKFGNYSYMIDSKLPLPPMFFSSNQFWPCKAKSITQCFNLSVYVYVSGYYKYTDMHYKHYKCDISVKYVEKLIN